MQIKKHLNGGTLRAVMVQEIKRVLAKYSGQDQPIEKAAMELGLAPRTLRVWKGPEEKGGWAELQGKGGMEKLLRTTKKKTKRAKTKKKASQEATAAVA